MKARSFYTGVLSLLFIFSSFNALAKRGRSVEDKANEIMRRFEGNLDAEKLAELRPMLMEILERNPGFDPTRNDNFDANVAANKIIEKYTDFKNIKQVLDQLKEIEAAKENDKNEGIKSLYQNRVAEQQQVQSTFHISTEAAASAVRLLVDKVGEGKISSATKKNLTDAIQLANSTIGPSLLKLANKVESARTEDVETIVKFAENIQDVTSEKENKKAPNMANILLDLGQNLHDMPFWDAQPRTTVMNVLKTFNEKLGEIATKEDVEVSLQVPGPPALNSPYAKVATPLRIGETIGKESALLLAITKNMIRMEDIKTQGLTMAIRLIKQRIRELCKG